MKNEKLLKNWELFCDAFSLSSRPHCFILGASRTGCSLAAFLAHLPIRITVADKSPVEIEKCRQSLSSQDLKAEIIYETGEHRVDSVLRADCIFLSPGIPLTLPVLREAKRSSIPVINDVELIFHLYQGAIIAITGSNGKSTVTDAVGKVICAAGNSALVAGNIGMSVFEAFRQCEKMPDFLVLELSSFQLESIVFFRPLIAVITNVSPDHLDRYENEEEYFRAKLAIAKNQQETDYFVINADNEWLVTHQDVGKGEKIFFSLAGPVKKGISLFRDVIHGSLGENSISLPLPDNFPDHIHRENVASLITLGFILDIPLEVTLEALAHYSGLPHRFERVATIAGRLFINDSKATNIGSVIAALRSVAPECFLIMGGRHKGGQFEELVPFISAKVKVLYCIGESAGLLARTFSGVVRVVTCTSLKEAVFQAFENSQKGDTVLLSPGCASFDMFRDFEERGDTFREITQQLAGEHQDD